MVSTKFSETRIIRLSSEQDHFATAFLNRTKADPEHGDIPLSVTARFSDGCEADIKCCNGDSPYVDPVLFDRGGVQLATNEVSGSLIGEYCFEVEDRQYKVIVEPPQTESGKPEQSLFAACLALRMAYVKGKQIGGNVDWGDIDRAWRLAGKGLVEYRQGHRAANRRKAYVIVQEGGSSEELNLHGHDTRAQAEADRNDCAQSGSYRTSPIIEVPASLAEHPDFYSVVKQIIGAVGAIDYPEAMETGGSAGDALEKLRESAADDAFAKHDFGDSTVTDSGQWTRDGKYWSRKIYGDAPGGERFMSSFGVEFAVGAAKIVDRWVQK